MPIAHPSSRTYRVLAGLIRPLLFATTVRDWKGAEHLPTQGGFVAAGNHLSNFDPLTFAHFLYDNGRAPRVLAKSSLWKVPGLGWALSRSGQIPVHRNTSSAGRSLEPAVAALRDGTCVAVFPEGTLTRDPDLWPMTAKTGVARLALDADVPVIPIAQWGAQDILPRYSKRLRPFPRKRVWVHAGPAVDLDDLRARPRDAATLREATARVMDAITALLEEIRGEQAPEVRFDLNAARRAERDAAASAAAPDAATPAPSDDAGASPDPTDDAQEGPRA